MPYQSLEKIRAAMSNMAFIDGQNLNLGSKECKWSIDHKKFRIYLLEKYHVMQAYYYLGFISPKEQDLYENLQKAGFILVFREHSPALKGNKKGNVDSDIIFGIMKEVLEETETSDPKKKFGKVFIVSGDGDYHRLVDFLIKRNKFGKMLFPNKKFASSLYKSLGGEYFDYLEEEGVKAKIQYIHK